jgi:hypothetical protein
MKATAATVFILDLEGSVSYTGSLFGSLFDIVNVSSCRAGSTRPRPDEIDPNDPSPVAGIVPRNFFNRENIGAIPSPCEARFGGQIRDRCSKSPAQERNRCSSIFFISPASHGKINHISGGKS